MLNPIALGIIVTATISYVVGLWILLSKAGEDGWKALVPLYGDYLLMKVTWATDAFVRRVAMLITLLLSLVGLRQLGALVITGEGLDTVISVASPFTLRQGIVGLCACVSLVWLLINWIKWQWYVADAFDGSFATFILLSLFPGYAHLGLAVAVMLGKKQYLGTLGERLAAEVAEYASYGKA